MKHTLSFSTIFSAILCLLLAACSSSTINTAAFPPPAGSNIDTSYTDALPTFLILAMGTLELDGAPDTITSEQAKALLPLWQTLRSSVNSGGGSQAELDALILQIEDALTESQVAAINALELTRDDMRAWAQDNGLVQGIPSPQMIATQQALAQSGQLGKAGVALLDAVTAYLEK